MNQAVRIEEVQVLIFVYNADSGLFNTLTDMAHKIFSPETYECNLCAITYGNLGMRQEWKEFLPTIGMPMEFLHRNEFHERYGMTEVPLPAVFITEGDGMKLLVSAKEIGHCHSVDDLKRLLAERTQPNR